MKDKLEFVSSIITNLEGNVLLLKRRGDLKLDPGKYDLCSGHMQEGEVPMQTMLRELEEELGISKEQIKYMQKLTDIKTPHEKLSNTICHMYHIEIDLSEKEINEMIQKVEKPEIEKTKYLKDIQELRTVQKYTKLMRTIYTEETEKIFRMVECTINKRKERDLCEER